MFKLLKRKPLPFGGKTTNEIIEEIHESFYTEVDRLLADAKISNSLETDKQDLLDKCSRLKNLGFTNSKEVKDAELEIERLRLLRIENRSKERLISAINYFTNKYPLYKFITEDSVKVICNKYNLVYGNISKYKGDVPDENLKQIEDFKIDKRDSCYVRGGSYVNGSYYSYSKAFPKKQNEELGTTPIDSYTLYKPDLRRVGYDPYYDSVRYKECELEIAAPLKDFDTKGLEVKGSKLSKIEIPDPVVLKPVMFNDVRYYLIVTAWGLEAQDELILNQINN